MYVLIERQFLPEGKYYEVMPDGRCIVPINEVKGMNLIGVDIIPSASEVNKLIEKMKAEPHMPNKDNVVEQPMVDILPADKVEQSQGQIQTEVPSQPTQQQADKVTEGGKV